MGKSVNTGKEANLKKGQFKKGDKRINRKGAPKRGESWTEIIAAIGNMTGPELSKFWDTEKKELAKLPKDVTLKELVTIHAYMALLNDFSANIWDKIMERAEGKVTQPILHEWREEARKHGFDPEKLIEEFFAKVTPLGSGVSVSGGVEEEAGTGSDSGADSESAGS